MEIESFFAFSQWDIFVNPNYEFYYNFSVSHCYLFSFTELFGNVMVCEHNWIINYL